MSNPWIPREIEAALVAEAGVSRPIWLVGGAVRDRLLERQVVDYDFAVGRDARQLARRVADRLGGAYFELDAERDTGRVLLSPKAPAQTIDFAGLRGDDIESDLRLRDFTINAMGSEVGGERSLLDPTGGLRDLKGRVLRLCYPNGLADDPVRSLRAVRLSTQLNLSMDPSLIAAIRADGGQLASASVERIRDELFSILDQPTPEGALRLAARLSLLGAALPPSESADLERGLSILGHLTRLMGTVVGDFDPEAPGNLTLAKASLNLGRFRSQLQSVLDAEVTGGRSRRQLILLAAALLPDAAGGGPAAQQRMTEAADRLHLGRAEMALLADVGAYVARKGLENLLPEPDPRQQYRYRRSLQDADVGVLLCGLAVELSGSAGPPAQDRWEWALEAARSYLYARFEEPATLFPEPLLRGDDLMAELAMEPGPEVGVLLERVREAQAAGDVSTAEEALELARRLRASR